MERLDAVSVPIGILDEAKFAYAKSTLEENNWLVMVSDGVLAAGDAWIMAVSYTHLDVYKRQHLLRISLEEQRPIQNLAANCGVFGW